MVNKTKSIRAPKLSAKNADDAPDAGDAPDADDARDAGEDLKVGKSGRRVRRLQRLLNAKGAALVEDGVFGPGTLAAVKRFQTQAGLNANGIAGTETIKVLKA